MPATSFDPLRSIGVAVAMIAPVLGCAPSSRPEAAPPADATHDAGAVVAPKPEEPPAAAPPVDAASAAPDASSPSPSPSSDAGAKGAAPAPATVSDPKVKVVTIGMHVGGGPFDEPTKEPFKKAVEPHFPEISQCWGKHVTKPPKEVDVGVDLLIEAEGGKPKVSNPRSTLPKSEAEGFVPCVVAVFENVEFPKLVNRGRTGVSYSLRFTRR